MNALAGGGSFVALPALIAAGMPSVQANASSTVALFPGGILSAIVYRGRVGSVAGVSLRPLLLVTLGGGLLGAVLLLETSTAAFDYIVPWLLLLATLALFFGCRIGAWLHRHWRVSRRPILYLQFALAIYGGYFGGAVGILMLAAWSLLDSYDFKALNASRTVMVSAANLMALLAFIVGGVVHWPETVTVMITASLGGVIGASVGRKAPPETVRAATLILATCITMLFFARAYLFK
jgi:hypothetical protein